MEKYLPHSISHNYPVYILRCGTDVSRVGGICNKELMSILLEIDC